MKIQENELRNNSWWTVLQNQQTLQIGNVPWRYQKMNWSSLNNNWSTFRQMWDQMKTTSFHGLISAEPTNMFIIKSTSDNNIIILLLLFFFQNFLGEIGTQEFTFSMSCAEELWASPWMQFWWSDPSLRHASQAPCYHQYSTPICLIIGLCQLASDHQREATVLGSARELGVAVWKQAQEDHSPV